MYVTTTNKLDPSSSITVASGPATQVEIDKVMRIWPNMSNSVENLALLYRRQQAELNANDTDFKRLWSEVDNQEHDIEELAQSTSLAQWFNKYHAGLEVMCSIPMGDFHI